MVLSTACEPFTGTTWALRLTLGLGAGQGPTMGVEVGFWHEGIPPGSRFSLRVHEKMGKDEGLWLRSGGCWGLGYGRRSRAEPDRWGKGSGWSTRAFWKEPG